MESDKGSKATDTKTEVEVYSTSSDAEINNVSVNTNKYNGSGQDDGSVNTCSNSSTCPCQTQVNAFGQVKTSRNMKRPKPPLPPLKKKDKPTRFSQRLVAKKNESLTIKKVWSHVLLLYS